MISYAGPPCLPRLGLTIRIRASEHQSSKGKGGGARRLSVLRILMASDHQTCHLTVFHDRAAIGSASMGQAKAATCDKDPTAAKTSCLAGGTFSERRGTTVLSQLV